MREYVRFETGQKLVMNCTEKLVTNSFIHII